MKLLRKLISQGNSLSYIYNAHGDVVKYMNQSGTVNRNYLTVSDREENPRFCIDPEPMVEVRENPLTGSDADFLFYPELYYAANGTVYMIHDCSAVAISETGEKLYETAPGYYFYDSMLTADGRVMVQAAEVRKSSEPFWAYSSYAYGRA